MRLFLNSIILVVLIGFSTDLKAQVPINWEICKDVTFSEMWSEEFQTAYQVPKFGNRISKLNGKKVKIRGYVIPIDIVREYYVLSAFPYSSCFFCGQAGPESVMEIQLARPYHGLRMDQILTFQGRLRLNADDIQQLNYVLENAEVVEE